MELKNMNILNFFDKKSVDNKAIAFLVLAFLPAIFVTKTIEATLIYLLMFLIYLIIMTFVAKLIDKVVPKDVRNIAVIITFVGVATIMKILTQSFFITFDSEFGLYIYFFAINALPYMLMADNEEKSLGKSLVNTIKSFLGFLIIMLIVSVVRELIGTGAITFGVYTSISFQINLFSKYALVIFRNPYGSLIILGLIVAALKYAVNKKGEIL